MVTPSLSSGGRGRPGADFWAAAKAAEILCCYLLAAVLDGHGMSQGGIGCGSGGAAVAVVAAAFAAMD